MCKFDIMSIKCFKNAGKQRIKFDTFSYQIRIKTLFLTYFRGVKMDALMVANYLTKLKAKTGLTYETISEQTGLSLSTVKNLFSGKSDDPRLKTVVPLVTVLNGSVDEMYSGKPKEAIQETSVAALKEMYEFQLAQQRKDEEIRVANIRADHDKYVEIINKNHEQISTEKDKRIKLLTKIAIVSCSITGILAIILIGLLILEVSNPNLGWLRF